MNIKLGNILISDIVKEEIKRFLTEELSIAEEVKSVTDDIFREIYNNHNYRFEYIFFDLGNFIVECEEVNVRNINEEIPCSVDVKNHILKISVPRFNGQINSATLKASIMHEIEHVFQISKTKDLKDSSFDDIYDIAINILNNKKCSREERFFARFVYCCSSKEQDGFVNELYSKLVGLDDYNGTSEASILRQSQAYRALMTIRNCVDELVDIKDLNLFSKETERFGKNLRWFVNIGRNATKRLSSKIGNVIKKARKDKLID